MTTIVETRTFEDLTGIPSSGRRKHVSRLVLEKEPEPEPTLKKITVIHPEPKPYHWFGITKAVEEPVVSLTPLTSTTTITMIKCYGVFKYILIFFLFLFVTMFTTERIETSMDIHTHCGLAFEKSERGLWKDHMVLLQVRSFNNCKNTDCLRKKAENQCRAVEKDPTYCLDYYHRKISNLTNDKVFKLES